MALATRVLVPDRTCSTSLERREPPPCAGPSSVRIRLALSREYSSRRLAGRGIPVADRRDRGARKEEQTFYVYDPALFLRYEETRRAVHGMLASMPRLLALGVDVSTDNWVSCSALEAVATYMRDRARQDDDRGLGGGRYHFSVQVAMEVALVYSEPKAVVSACADTVMQTAEPGSADSDHHCSICMEGFENVCAGPMAPVNLPCSHPFHTQCITVWLFEGHSCPVCRHELRGMVSAPWASQARKHGEFKYLPI